MGYLDSSGLARFKSKLDVLFDSKLSSTLKGSANGLAELNSSGKVPENQLPSYVDDVVEYSSFEDLPASGETGKIYVTTNTNETYRWSGTTYVAVGGGVALGETSETAYRGDRGKAAYDHASENGKVTTPVTAGLYKVSVTGEGHIGSADAVTKADIELLGIPGADTWRGIQDNLTSEGNTTDSLSANQGFLLANGAARDNSKRSDDAPEVLNWFKGTPRVDSQGGMEVGKQIDFHATDDSELDYSARISADNTGFTLTGTTKGTFSGDLTGDVTGDLTGNADTATQLETPRTINGTNFDGTSNITTNKWGTIRTITIKDADSTNAGTAIDVDGSGNVILPLPSTIKASLTGNVTGNVTGNLSGNASTSTKWAAAQTVYVALGTASTTTTIQGGSSSAVALGVNGTLGIGNGGTGATTAANARNNLGLGSIATYGAATAGTKDTWGLVPVIGASDGVMEIGKYIDFHVTDGNTKDYDVRITADTAGLTISGTTTGTFKGNVTGNCSGSSGSCTGNAATCTYPLGFSSRSTNATWGNQTGTTITAWSDSAGGSCDWRMNNPSSGKMSLKVDGRFYGNEGTYPAMLMRNENNYWGLCDPDAANNVWIRTTTQGIIPYQSGGAGSGHGGLGTSSWYFSAAYIDNIYGKLNGNCTGSSGSCTGNAATATQLASAGTTGQFYRGDRTWSNQLSNHIFNTTDIPEGAANLSASATAHKITFYRNGLSIPYQMDNANDGGILRVRGTSESNCIFELGTWDDSGAGETIQFNYYPTTSQVTPTYSVTVPKRSGTICCTDQAISNITRSGTTFTATRANGTTFTFTQQDNNTTYTLAGLGGAKASEAIKNISRSGTTFTATRCDGTTFTFTQQDNNTNTWRGIQNNLTSTSTTDSLSAAQGKALYDKLTACTLLKTMTSASQTTVANWGAYMFITVVVDGYNNRIIRTFPKAALTNGKTVWFWEQIESTNYCLSLTLVSMSGNTATVKAPWWGSSVQSVLIYGSVAI